MKRLLLTCALLLASACPLQGAVVTLREPTADEVMQHIYNRKMRVGTMVPIAVSQKYAIVLILLHPNVVQPADYPALKQAVEAVTGITEIKLLIDGTTPLTVPAGTELKAVVEGQLRIEKLPVEEPPE